VPSEDKGNGTEVGHHEHDGHDDHSHHHHSNDTSHAEHDHHKEHKHEHEELTTGQVWLYSLLAVTCSSFLFILFSVF
jgi:ABC-type nickel/cobalt efflux system permease component RcnA